MLAKFRPVVILIRREVRDQFRDWRIILPVLILTLIFPWLLNMTARTLTDFFMRYGGEIIGDRLLPFLLLLVGFFPITVSLVIALESFVGEKERRSIEPLLSSPLEDWQLYLGKLVASLVVPILSSYLGIAVYLVGIVRQLNWNPSLELLLLVILLTTIQGVVMVSGAVVISTQTTSVRAANLLASFIIVPMALVLQGETVAIFWGYIDLLWWVVLGELLIAGMLIRMGVVYFSREELLGRELDSINLRWSWQVFKKAFVGKARTPGEWVVREIPNTISRLLLPIGIMIGLQLAGILLGASQANSLQIPASTFQEFDQVSIFMENLEQLDFFTVKSIPYLWLHNLRALSLAAFLGIFSFGVLGILIIMLPLAIIGFIMAAVSSSLSPLVFFSAFVLPHGVLEIPVLVIAGAAILRLGATLTTPARGKTIGEAWLGAFADWTKVMLGIAVPLLLGSAILEVLITPRIALMILGS
jgi:uncharacterized membrane protein SpoIIM required for sporulation/ABC-type transport system involved in multi-copper enzyme maturation permease subunit